MSTLLLPFAMRTADGQFVSPEDVSRGLACNCVCPECGDPVQARHGTERAWHFAHSTSSDCVGAYEKSVHEAAKQLLRDRKELLLPVLSVTVEAVDAFNRLLRESETIFGAKRVNLEACKYGQVFGDVKPDLVGTLRERRLLIEVTVFHRLMPDKQERLEKTGLAILEIDLNEFRTMQATRERLEAALFTREDNRRWVWHPAKASAEERLHESLRQRLAAVEAERSERAKKEQAEQAHQPLVESCRRSHPAIEPRLPVAHDVSWRAGFPAEERWSPAREAFCERHGLSRERVDAVFGSFKKRSELARTTPEKLAKEWGEALGVSPGAIHQYFAEGCYVL